jgi:hypothetical protein
VAYSVSGVEAATGIGTLTILNHIAGAVLRSRDRLADPPVLPGLTLPAIGRESIADESL